MKIQDNIGTMKMYSLTNSMTSQQIQDGGRPPF